MFSYVGLFVIVVFVSRWIILLRGVNVGGKNKLPMKDLVTLLEDLGWSDVKTYIQSGNVAAVGPRGNRAEFAESIAASILQHSHFKPDIHLMTAKEFEGAAAKNPFPGAIKDPKSLHLSFLSKVPSPKSVEALEALMIASESFEIIGKTLYFHAPEGIGRSKFAANVERLLGVSATGRNWRTIESILGLL